MVKITLGIHRYDRSSCNDHGDGPRCAAPPSFQVAKHTPAGAIRPAALLYYTRSPGLEPVGLYDPQNVLFCAVSVMRRCLPEIPCRPVRSQPVPVICAKQ